jgi:hypothetical protein
MGALCRPYTLDLFFSVALMLPAVCWTAKPQAATAKPQAARGVAPLVALVVIAPVALLSSYPAVFVAVAVALVLLPGVWRSRRADVRALYALFVLLVIGVFLGNYLLIARTHLSSPTGGISTGESMAAYWQHGFPPAAPLAFLPWLASALTGQMAAYPIGSASGGSLLTVLLCLVGLRDLWQRRQLALVGLIAGTFLLSFLAALLRKYPFGASCRLAQHLAPMYCLLAGLGAAVLIERLGTSTARGRATVAVAAVLLLIGLGGIVRDVIKPYRDEDARLLREVFAKLLERTSTEPILLQSGEELPPLVQWHLARNADCIRRLQDDHLTDLDSILLLTIDRPDQLSGLAGWRCLEAPVTTQIPVRALGRHVAITTSRWRRVFIP